MNRLSRKNFIYTGLLLFSMFFGAGNLIFPPFSGNQAGTSVFGAMLGISITAVLFPVLGVAAVAKTDGLDNLAGRVHKIFALSFSVLIYLSIGPMIAIPRAATVPFEMAFLPYLPQDFSPKLALLIFSFIFFALTYWLSAMPNKLVDRMGKILSPLLILFILVIFVVIAVGPKNIAPPTGNYSNSAFLQGFIDGYQTMDVAAALVFGLVVTVIMKSYQLTDRNVIVKSTILIGILAGIILGIIYFMIGYVGAAGSGFSQSGENGAQILSRMVIGSFGNFGIVIVGITFLLACLTTCVGLVTSCSEYFSSLIPKISYKAFALIITIFSFAIANQGLSKILSFSVPILIFLYPICFVLIGLAFLDPLFKGNRRVYQITVGATAVLSFLDAFQTNLEIDIMKKLPLGDFGLSWVLPVAFVFILGCVVVLLKNKA